MLPYWLMFGTAAAGALAYGDPNANRSRILLIAFAVALTLMVGARFLVGGDWFTYAQIYREIGDMNLGAALTVAKSDPAFSLLNWLAYQLGSGVWLTNMVCGALLMWGITALALRQPNPWLVLVIAIPYLIIVVGMGYTRQAAAIGLIAVATLAFTDGRFKTFIATILFATLFHKTAIVILPLFGLSVAKNRFMTIIFLAGFSVLLFALFLSSRMDLLTANYVQARYQSAGAVQRVLLNLVPAVLYLVAQRRFGFSDQERKFWKIMALGALVAGGALLVVSSSTLIDRLSLYLMVLQLVILGRLPWAFGRYPRARPELIVIIIVYAAAIQFVWLNYAMNAGSWLPYRSYLTE